MSSQANTDLPVMNPPSSASNAGEKGVTITEKALRQIRLALEKEGVTPAQAGMRLGVQGGGCSGLTYKIRVDSKPHQRDRVYTHGDLRIFVDPKSFLYLNGMVLDWEETLMQRGFVFKNPNATKSCGCGTSFSG